MLFRTILYSLIAYGVFWLVRRLFGSMFGASAGKTGKRSGRRYGSKAVNADFEEINDKHSDGTSGKDASREE